MAIFDYVRLLLVTFVCYKLFHLRFILAIINNYNIWLLVVLLLGLLVVINCYWYLFYWWLLMPVSGYSINDH
jgi:hypothetical protein